MPTTKALKQAQHRVRLSENGTECPQPYVDEVP